MHQQLMIELGWDFLIVWECQIFDKAALENKLCQFLESWTVRC